MRVVRDRKTRTMRGGRSTETSLHNRQVAFKSLQSIVCPLSVVEYRQSQAVAMAYRNGGQLFNAIEFRRMSSRYESSCYW